MTRTALLAVLIPVAAACAADLGPEPNNVPDGVVFLAQNEPPAVFMQALYQGPVTLDTDGCLRVESQYDAVVVWPYGTRLRERGGVLFVVDARGRELGRIGGTFEMGGGFVSDTHHYLSDADHALARSRCPSDDYWIAGEMH